MLHYTNSCHVHLLLLHLSVKRLRVSYMPMHIRTQRVINRSYKQQGDCMPDKYDEAYGRNFDDITLKLAKKKRTQFICHVYVLLFFYANKHKISCFVSVSHTYTHCTKNIKYADFIFKYNVLVCVSVYTVHYTHRGCFANQKEYETKKKTTKHKENNQCMKALAWII